MNDERGMKWCVETTMMYCIDQRKWYGCEKCKYYLGTEDHFGEKLLMCSIRHPYTWPIAKKEGAKYENADVV